MNVQKERILLVGDNPFHGISHLSQARVRDRGGSITSPENAADLVAASLENGANGFMFSVSETTLSILRLLKKRKCSPIGLYALVPYAYEYVRLATRAGGIQGLSNQLAKRIAFSGNIKVATLGLKGAVGKDLHELLKAYLAYEISRIKSSTRKIDKLHSVLLHEIVTDMALALDAEWVFKLFIDFISKYDINPGFETRNFPFLVRQFNRWNISLSNVIVAAPFNKIGFFMNPSKNDCEQALASLDKPNIIAMSVLAAGYLKPSEAMDYIENLPNIGMIVVGVSNKQHALGISQFTAKRK